MTSYDPRFGQWRKCYNVSRVAWNLLEEDDTTYHERLGSYLKKTLRCIKSVLEATWSRCYDVSRAPRKLLEEDVAMYQERLGSYLKTMLRCIKSALEVTWRRSCDVSRASWKLLEEDVTMYQERLGSYLKKMLRCIKSVSEVTWRRCCNVAMLQRSIVATSLKRRRKNVVTPPKTPNSQKWQQSRPSRSAATANISAHLMIPQNHMTSYEIKWNQELMVTIGSIW